MANAQAYYLYVGSTLGAKDLVDTGEIQPISYLTAGLPRAQTVFARLWTKVGGIWRSTDSTFTTSAATVPVVATLTSPIDGATNVNMTLPIQWTAVSNVEAYYLYVGSTFGAKDLVDTWRDPKGFLPGFGDSGQPQGVCADVGEGRRHLALHRQQLHDGGGRHRSLRH